MGQHRTVSPLAGFNSGRLPNDFRTAQLWSAQVLRFEQIGNGYRVRGGIKAA
jgi:hypothetical protein